MPPSSRSRCSGCRPTSWSSTAWCRVSVRAPWPPGCRAATGATYTLATTGVAGPDSQEGRPVGTVFVVPRRPGRRRRGLTMELVRRPAPDPGPRLSGGAVGPVCRSFAGNNPRSGSVSLHQSAAAFRTDLPARRTPNGAVPPAAGRRPPGASSRAGLTLRQVSAEARVSLGYISEIERGQKEASSELLASLCSCARCTALRGAARRLRGGRRRRGRQRTDPDHCSASRRRFRCLSGPGGCSPWQHALR